MKKLFNILMSLTLVAILTGCNFLDRKSKTLLDDSGFWTSEDMVRYFVNGAYDNYFAGYDTSWGQVYAPGVYSSGEFSDDGSSTGQQTQPRQTVPSDNWYRAEGSYWLFRTGAGPWNFGWVRKWNLMMDRLDMMKEEGNISDEGYNHWYGVARFFRGYEYSRIVQSFGDAPWFDYVVESTDYDSQYKDRDPRTLVMANVLEDFKFAHANVRANDGANFVNKDVVATIASRCMLFEGTWYKYHKNDAAMKTCSDVDALQKKFLEAARDFAAAVMATGKYSFDTDFRTLFGSEKQSGKEIIMYRSYSADAAINVTHCIASYSNLDENQTRSANLANLKSWICNDGLPYQASSVENAGELSVANMAVTRDPRFEATFWHQPTSGQTGVYCVKFIDRTGPTYSYNGQTRPPKYGSMTNTNGFPVLRYAEVVLNWIEAKAELDEGTVSQADLDASINAIRNRPLDADAIAKGVKKTAPLTLAMIAADSDPLRTSPQIKATHAGEVSPLLWEIRRERRMEFFMEQYRVLDIRRWGWLELMNSSVNPDIQYGAWVDLGNTLKKATDDGVQKGNPDMLKEFNLLTGANFGKVGVMKADGSIVMFNGEKDASGNILSSNAADMVGYRVVQNYKDRDQIQEKHYLEPICKDVINQYKSGANGKSYTIYQNAGWEE